MKNRTILLVIISAVLLFVFLCGSFAIRELKTMEQVQMYRVIAIVVAVLGLVIAFIGHTSESEGLGGAGESLVLFVALPVIIVTSAMIHFRKTPTQEYSATPSEYRISIPNYDKFADPSVLFLEALILKTEEESTFQIGNKIYKNVPKGVLVIFVPAGWNCRFVTETNSLLCNDIYRYDINHVTGMSGNQEQRGFVLPYIVPCRTGIDQYQGTYCQEGNYILVNR